MNTELDDYASRLEGYALPISLFLGISKAFSGVSHLVEQLTSIDVKKFIPTSLDLAAFEDLPSVFERRFAELDVFITGTFVESWKELKENWDKWTDKSTCPASASLGNTITAVLSAVEKLKRAKKTYSAYKCLLTQVPVLLNNFVNVQAYFSNPETSAAELTNNEYVPVCQREAEAGGIQENAAAFNAAMYIAHGCISFFKSLGDAAMTLSKIDGDSTNWSK